MSRRTRDHLWRLIADRQKPGADRAAIEARIRDLFEETWTVAFTDLVGFSRRAHEFGIVHFLSLIYEKGRILRDLVAKGGGRILKEEADSWLLLFRAPRAAVDTLLACQNACAAHNRGRADEDRIELCVGIGHGPVLRIGDEDVWGEEVNVASRLGEDVARAGEVLLSDAAWRALAPNAQGLLADRRESRDFPEGWWRVRPVGERTAT